METNTFEMSHVRALLTQKPSQELWESLCGLLQRWPDGDEKQAVVEYACSHVASWPATLRTLEDRDHPLFPVCATLHTVLSAEAEEELATLSAFLETHTQIAALSFALQSTELVQLSAFSGASRITRLVVHDDAFAEELDALSEFPALRDLCLQGGEGWGEFGEVGPLPLLETLTFDGVEELDSLSLDGYRSLKKLDGLASVSGLSEISLQGCVALENLDGVAEVTGLFRLDLSEEEEKRTRAQRTTLLRGVAPLDGLQVLYLSGWDVLGNEELDAIAALPALNTLGLAHIGVVQDLECLTGLPALGSLRLDEIRDEDEEIVEGTLIGEHGISVQA